MPNYKRFTAKKVRIKELLNGDFKEEERVLFSNSGRKIKRVRLMATVVRKFISDDGKYGFLVLDDSSETMRTKAFREDVRKIKNIGEGDIVDIIGRLDKYEDELYLRPEIVRKIEDPNWLLVRKLELHLQKARGEEEESEEEIKEVEEKEEGEEVVVEEVKAPKEIVLEFLKKEGETKFEEIMEELELEEEETKDALKTLMQEGEVFEPKKKTYKALD